MPYPDGRQTKAERHYRKCRGPLGLHVLTGTSFSSPQKVTREFARAMWHAGYEVSCEVQPGQEEGWTRTSIRHLEGLVHQPFASLSWGRSFCDFEGQARIEIDAVDTFSWANPKDVAYINDRVDLLVVPGQSSYDYLRRGGVTVPIEIVPFGFDPIVYQPWPVDEELIARAVFPGMGRRGEFLFLTGGFIQDRKGLKECLQAFTDAFQAGMEASLIVLCNTIGHGKDASELVREAAQRAPVAFLPGPLDEWSMARLYSSVDCFVSCHKLEGFGLMPLEAMACGTPAMFTDWDGPTTYSAAYRARAIAPSGTRLAVVSVSHREYREAIVDTEAVAQGLADSASAGHPARDERSRISRSSRKWTWYSAAEGSLLPAIIQHCSPLRRRLWLELPQTVPSLTRVLAAHPPSGDIGDALTAVHYQPGRIASFAMLQSGGSFDFSQSPGSVCAMLLGDNATDWTDPVEHLGLRGAPLAGLCCEDDPRYWLDWPGGYFPRGLGLLDMALWARSHVPDFVVADCDCKVTGLPPWWDGASGQAEAEERLASHLEQLTFWWADLLHHIRRTGWW